MQTFLHFSLLIALVGQNEPRLEDEKPRYDAAQAKLWVAFYEREAGQYDISVGRDQQRKLLWKRNPVYRWASPELGNEFNGAVFVWTLDGRAEVIGTIWSQPLGPASKKRHLVHEFISLSRQPIMAKRFGAKVWYPAKTGMESKPIPDAPKPADSTRRRLIQMRKLAREFTATVRVRNRIDNPRKLRMLSQPIYRFEQKTPDAVDGAVFALLIGWDPELFLIIEEQENSNGRRWHLALTRFCVRAYTVRHKDVVVWTCDYSSTSPNPRGTYFLNLRATTADRFLKDIPAGDGSKKP